MIFMGSNPPSPPQKKKNNKKSRWYQIVHIAPETTMLPTLLHIFEHVSYSFYGREDEQNSGNQ